MDTDNPITVALERARALGASDLHVAPGKPLVARIHGRIARPLPELKVNGEHIRAFVTETIDKETRERLKVSGVVDGSLEEHERFGPVRIHAYQSMGRLCLALRLLATSVARFDDLGLPAVMRSFVMQSSGLILFVGPTGSGKTTTQASLIQLMLDESPRHVITIEDPIEYRFRDGKGAVTQIEVGPSGDSRSFAETLASILRSDPDVVLVGECRDAATLAACLEIAEQGRLCLSTVHARDASSVFDRIIGAFGTDAQPQVRVQLAAAISAVVVQRLLPRRDGGGRVAAAEVLVATDSVKALIRDDKTQQLRNAISTGRAQGMQTLEAAISELVYGKNLVDETVGKAAAVRPEEVRPGGAVPTAPAAVTNGTQTVRPIFPR